LKSNTIAGIRIGYYTAALSIWIANLWAPSEIYFLRHVTVVFLVSMLIGVSVLSMYPHSVHAVEPFMVMHVSYCVSVDEVRRTPPHPTLILGRLITWACLCLQVRSILDGRKNT
jgi:hypothetical protein